MEKSENQFAPGWLWFICWSGFWLLFCGCCIVSPSGLFSLLGSCCGSVSSLFSGLSVLSCSLVSSVGSGFLYLTNFSDFLFSGST
jgi:hypothetical protein